MNFLNIKGKEKAQKSFISSSKEELKRKVEITSLKRLWIRHNSSLLFLFLASIPKWVLSLSSIHSWCLVMMKSMNVVSLQQSNVFSGGTNFMCTETGKLFLKELRESRTIKMDCRNTVYFFVYFSKYAILFSYIQLI